MAYHLALVTGATSGIGKATCELFAANGINLIIAGRNQAFLRLVQENLSKKVNVEMVVADLSKREERNRLIALMHERQPELVINNAGFGLYGEALSYTTEEQTNILKVNGEAVLELTLEAARTLISHQKKGVILNVSSAAAFHIFPGMAIYAASKTFVNHFSQAFDFEMKRHGVRVLTLCPGMVATDFQRRAGGAIDSKHIGVLSAAYVAEQIWKQIEQLDPLLVIDWKYRLLNFFASLIPTSWMAPFEERIIASRITPRTIIKLEK